MKHTEMDGATARTSRPAPEIQIETRLCAACPCSTRRTEGRLNAGGADGHESVNRAYESTLVEGLRFERRLFHALFATEDQKEAAAFLQKRAPRLRHRRAAKA